MFKNLRFLLAVLFWASCVKDKPDTPGTSIPVSGKGKVLVVCEGSLGNGNGELSVFMPSKDSTYNTVFKNANGQALGDVFQSLNKINGNYWLCVNNSDKIVVIDPDNWKQKASIAVSKPRYCYAVSDTKAYVGSLFSNRIYILDTKNYTVQGQISMPYQNVEGILVKGNIAYVCCWDTACSKLYSIDVRTDKVVDSIALAGAAPQSILQDKESKLWIAGGNVYKHKNSSLSRIDMGTNKMVSSCIFANGIEAIKPCLNPSKDTLYFLEVNYDGGGVNNGVFRMPVGSTSLPGQAFVGCGANQYFWALGIDPISGKIYVGDPKGFIQMSGVQVYDAGGTVLHRFSTDLGVGAFYFD